MRSRLLLWSCACVASLGLASPAWAQDEPQIDPDSPAGTEYELPVDRARDDASPGASKGSGEAPLFGEGVGGTESSGAQGSSSDRGSGSGSNSRSSATREAPGASAPKPVERADASAPSSGAGQIVAIGAGAAGVLLLGGIGGLAWRRRSGER